MHVLMSSNYVLLLIAKSCFKPMRRRPPQTLWQCSSGDPLSTIFIRTAENFSSLSTSPTLTTSPNMSSVQLPFRSIQSAIMLVDMVGVDTHRPIVRGIWSNLFNENVHAAPSSPICSEANEYSFAKTIVTRQDRTSQAPW